MENKILNTDVLSKEYINNIIPSKFLDVEIQGITTGNIMLDKMIGCNGIPKGRITEIYGNESCGKTTLCLQIARGCTVVKKKVLYIDLEYALDINYVKAIGIDTDYFFVAHTHSGENAFGMIEDALNNQSFELIIIDSVAAMQPENEIDTKIEDINALGSHARLMSRGIRKIQYALSESQTAIVFINQLREKIGVTFGNPETTTGGKALKFYSSVRLELKKVELIKDGEDKIGIKTKITTVKNKIGIPFQNTFINIYFGTGFNYLNDILEFAISKNIIHKNGSWYSYKDEKIAQGINQLRNYFKENEDLLEEVKNLCL
ncbi:MAG: recombinase RecA [Ureaplasma sp.]|nr:recombinase RecA [Ureaplasma sp.]